MMSDSPMGVSLQPIPKKDQSTAAPNVETWHAASLRCTIPRLFAFCTDAMPGVST